MTLKDDLPLASLAAFERIIFAALRNLRDLVGSQVKTSKLTLRGLCQNFPKTMNSDIVQECSQKHCI